ncbi:hypothetical protein BG005_005157 [Podila minutissima]|nr:hypothetical protein BG005_005157 [Podila minutissima]
MRTTIIALALIGAAFSPPPTAFGAAVPFLGNTRNSVAFLGYTRNSVDVDLSLGQTQSKPVAGVPPLGRTTSNSVPAVDRTGPFFEPLTSSLSNFSIPDNQGPDRWACSYIRGAVDTPDINGTSITIAKKSNRKPFSCGELVHIQRPQYGVYSVDMISTNVRGHVTGFFLIANGVSEIDVELTGLDSEAVWFNIWEGSKQNPVKIPLGFDAAKEFHNYQIEWRKDFIAWSVDGKQILKRSDINTVDPATNPYKLALNSWTTAVEEKMWAGKFKWPGKPIRSQFRNLRYTP